MAGSTDADNPLEKVSEPSHRSMTRHVVLQFCLDQLHFVVSRQVRQGETNSINPGQPGMWKTQPWKSTSRRKAGLWTLVSGDGWRRDQGFRSGEEVQAESYGRGR